MYSTVNMRKVLRFYYYIVKGLIYLFKEDISKIAKTLNFFLFIYPEDQ